MNPIYEAALKAAADAVPQIPPYGDYGDDLRRGRDIGYKDAAFDAKSAIIALPVPPLADMIKPLEWKPGSGDQLVARAPWGEYSIVKPWFTGLGIFWLRGSLHANCDTLDEAFAAAQADYAARIIAAFRGIE